MSEGEGERDLAWEALDTAEATARTVARSPSARPEDYSLYLVLGHVKAAYESGAIRDWARRLECGERRPDEALASLYVAG